MLPLVSVLCVSYNHEKFIERTLLSVIGQTYADFEIIYIDDHSQDKSFQTGKKILENSGARFFAHRMEKNTGLSKVLNFATKEIVSGKYIATLACDDFWDIYNLQDKVRYFEANPEFGMVYGNGYYYFDDSKEIKLYYKKPSISGWILKDLLKAPAINPQGILYRYDVLKEINFFDENAKVEDRDIWYRIAEKYPIGYVDTPLTFYRIHNSNISSDLLHMRAGTEYFFKKYEHAFPKEIKIARMKQERFIAYSLIKKSPTFKTFFRLLRNYKFNWLYTKEIARSLILAVKNTLNRSAIVMTK